MRPVGAGVMAAVAVFGLAVTGAAADTACNAVAVSRPLAGSTVSGTVSILGSASIDAFGFYKVEWAEAHDPDSWHAVSATVSKPVRHGTLDTWNTTKLPDGTYRLRLVVVDASGQEPCKRLVEGLLVANDQDLALPTSVVTPTVVLYPAGPGELPTVAPPTQVAAGPGEAPTATAGPAGQGAVDSTAVALAGQATQTASADFPIELAPGPTEEQTDLGFLLPTDSIQSAAASLGAGRWPRAFAAGAIASIVAGLALLLLLGLRRPR